MFHVEHHGKLKNILMNEGLKLGIQINESHVCNLMTYLSELKKWNKKINLTSVHEDREIIAKHFLDSIIPLSIKDFPLSGSMLDIGTGAGFPGIPLKIVNGDLELVLLEPSQKKSAFLRYIVGALNLKNVSVCSEKLEVFSRNIRYKKFFNIVVIRALSLKVVLPYLHEIMDRKGHIVLYRSKPLEELDQSFRLRISREIVHSSQCSVGRRCTTILTPC